MDDKRSLLKCEHIQVSDDITIRIPTVGEILENEQMYYSIVNQITASPYSMMVELDDIGIDFMTITDYELFLKYSFFTFSQDLTILFGNTFSKLYNFLADEKIPLEKKEEALFLVEKKENNCICLYDAMDDVLIDEFIYLKITDCLRRINILEKDNRKAGNESAKKYLIDKNRRYKNRHKNDKYVPMLENYVVALVNKQEFKYNYEETMNLSIYKFNRSLKQIKHTVCFDKLMIGVYAGTVDTSKISDRSMLDFIDIHN